MEILHQILIESVSGGFWKFMGYALIIYMVAHTTVQLCVIILRTLAYIIGRPLRHYTLMKHGYPPEHCDADGDIIEN